MEAKYCNTFMQIQCISILSILAIKDYKNTDTDHRFIKPKTLPFHKYYAILLVYYYY